MRSRMKAVMAMAVVVVAVSAIGVSAASATQSEPYFVAVKGALPMKAAATIGVSWLHFSSGFAIVCDKGSDSGEILNTTVSGQSIGGLRKGTFTFEDCTVENPGFGECTIEGKENGQFGMTWTGVTAELGYAPGHANKENVRFHLTSENFESVFTTVAPKGETCYLKGEKYKVGKGIIGAVPSIDIEQPLTEVSLAFKTNEAGRQELTEIENPGVGTKVKEELQNWSVLGIPGLERTDLLKLTEAGDEVEIKL